jgi:hypothetical protein
MKDENKIWHSEYNYNLKALGKSNIQEVIPSKGKLMQFINR